MNTSTSNTPSKQPLPALATHPAPVPPRSRLTAHIVTIIVAALVAPLACGLILYGSQLLELKVLQGSVWGSAQGTAFLALGLLILAGLAIFSGAKSTFGMASVLLTLWMMTLYQSTFTPIAIFHLPALIRFQVDIFGWSSFTPGLLGGSLGATYAMYIARRAGIYDVRDDQEKLQALPRSGVRLPPAPSSRRISWIVSTAIGAISAIIIFIAFFLQAANIDFSVAAPPVRPLGPSSSIVWLAIIVTIVSALLTGSAYISSFGAMVSTSIFLIAPAIVISLIGVLSTGSPIKGGSVFAWLSALSTPVGVLGSALFLMSVGAHFARKEGRRREIRDLERLEEESKKRSEQRDKKAKEEALQALSDD
ncbi:MAG: hypothetical protein Q4P66_07030 [Actinomycetaceae bacterium]|nr:hypothetical protein [Actinomycetaceae bacterium]